jgi:hypothetical protein
MALPCKRLGRRSEEDALDALAEDASWDASRRAAAALPSDSNADSKDSQGASAPLHYLAAPSTHMETLKKDYFDDRNS